MINCKDKKGATVLEVLLVVAMIAMMGALSAPVYLKFQNQNDIDNTTTLLVQTLRRAQLSARAGHNDSSWGVYIQNGSITLFSGNDYSLRNSDFDDTININPNISINGNQEIIFSKLHGEPNVNGNTTLTLATVIKSISINSKGTVDYD